HAEKVGRAYDALLILWLQEHPYFRRFVVRLLESPLYVPDVTNIGQLGLESVKGTAVPAISETLVRNCMARLKAVGWGDDELSSLRSCMQRRAKAIIHECVEGAVDRTSMFDCDQ